MEYTVTVKYKGLYPDNKLEARMVAAIGKSYGNHGGYIDDHIRDVDWFFPTQADAFAASLTSGSIRCRTDAFFRSFLDAVGDEVDDHFFSRLSAFRCLSHSVACCSLHVDMSQDA
jgi:hypothetical protein